MILPEIGTTSFFSVFVEGIISTFIIGAIIYVIAHVARRGQGVNLSLMGKEIPPE